MAKLKICGLTRTQDVEAVNAVLPEYIGFVFAPSRRRVTPKQAAALAEGLHPAIKKVGVFVNEAPQSILNLVHAGSIDVIQLHGDEDAAYLRELHKHTQVPLIKAVRVQSAEQVWAAAKLPCEFLLLDTYTKGVYGGSGKPFDWRVIPAITKPFFLAGGLDAENIKTALTECKPYAVDISSGVESEGLKDKTKIITIAELVRSVE